MADLHTYKKLPSDPCLTQEQITAYIDGKLSVAEQHACEKHILDCEMCEDAVEGIALVKDRSVLAAPLKTDQSPAESKVIPLRPNRRILYAVAAVLVLVLGSTFLIKILSTSTDSSPLAMNEEASMDSSVAPAEAYALKDDKQVATDSVSALRQELPGVSGPPSGTKNELSVTLEDANKVMEADKAPVSPPMVAEAEEYVNIDNERLADGDDEMFDLQDDGTARTEKVVAVPEDKEKQESKPEKKNSLIDIAKSGAGIASGTKAKNRGVTDNVKQDAYVDSRNDSNANAPSGGNVVSGNTQPATTQTQAQPEVVGGVGYTSYEQTDSAVTLLAETVAARDSVAVDQLELSYQNGVNQLNAGQTNNAIVMFDKVLANKNHARYEDAELQKAKALIKANRKEEAKTLLKTIETKKGKHAAEATELLKSL